MEISLSGGVDEIFNFSLSCYAFLPICCGKVSAFNLDSIKKSLGFSSFYSKKNHGRKLKIAVLDKGFKWL